jgi:hypothetical protein
MGVRASKRPWEMVVLKSELSPGRLQKAGLLAGVLVLALAASPIAGGEESVQSQFKYAGGTEILPEGCEGNLELRPEFMAFTCRGGEVSVPYSSITLMQYRSGISWHVRHLKVPWKVRPVIFPQVVGGKKNRYFTVIYRLEGHPRVLILRVHPDAMRPYLAELDLRSQKRVEVQSYEEY